VRIFNERPEMNIESFFPSLAKILQNQEKIMSGLTDLQTAVTSLGAAVTTETTNIAAAATSNAAAIADIQNAVTALAAGGDSDARSRLLRRRSTPLWRR
jgi:hypothetical protein